MNDDGTLASAAVGEELLKHLDKHAYAQAVVCQLAAFDIFYIFYRSFLQLSTLLTGFLLGASIAY